MTTGMCALESEGGLCEALPQQCASLMLIADDCCRLLHIAAEHCLLVTTSKTAIHMSVIHLFM